jgi:hypothetical protein
MLSDGVRVLSCFVLATCVDGEVTTVEGLAAEGARLHPMQQAFLECDAYQCGIRLPLTGEIALGDRRPKRDRTDGAGPVLTGNDYAINDHGFRGSPRPEMRNVLKTRPAALFRIRTLNAARNFAAGRK